MAKRWLIGGLAVGVGALAVAPEARTWLRRRLGLEPEDRRWFEEEGAEAESRDPGQSRPVGQVDDGRRLPDAALHVVGRQDGHRARTLRRSWPAGPWVASRS